MNKWIKGLGIIGSENEGTKHRQEPIRRNMPRGNHPTDNEVQIMHTSAQSSSYGDGSSLPSTVRGCGQGMDARQLPPSGFQPSANPVLAETFERHWQQLRGIAAHNTTVPTPDDVVAVSNLLDQMTSLLEMEQSMLDDLLMQDEATLNGQERIQMDPLQQNEDASRRGNQGWGLLPGTSVVGPVQNQHPFLARQDSSEPNSLTNTPCLDILLSENILAHILAASRMPVAPEHADQMRLQQLKLYETLLGGSAERARQLLSHQPFLRPLLDLLNQFAAAKTENMNSSQSYSPIYYSEDHVINRTKYGEPRLRTNDHHFSDGNKKNLPFLKEENNSEDLSISYQTETHLVSLLNQLCSRLMEKENAKLLDVFFHASQNMSSEANNTATEVDQDTSDKASKFPVFTILVGFLHFDGNVGQQARDALLLCMTLSKRHDEVGKHIARNTNFCPLLATGLSGLYSLLPRRLPKEPAGRFYNPNWHRITQEDLSNNRLGSEMDNFLSSLEFYDAVIQVAHPTVRQNLLGLIYMGFLVPVLGPALTQAHLAKSPQISNLRFVEICVRYGRQHMKSLEAELICSTAYVDLFIRRITEPSLLAYCLFLTVEGSVPESFKLNGDMLYSN